jgi:ribose 5-phosphate isomerase B
MKKFLIASDHAGYEFKEALKAKTAALLAELGYVFEDLGTHSLESVDYPDYAAALHSHLTTAQKTKSSEENKAAIGLLICGSGVGISIKANRYPEIRAVLAQTPNVARLGREHNHANVLCMGARIVSVEEGAHILKAFLEGKPDEGERHVRRINKLYEC